MLALQRILKAVLGVPCMALGIVALGLAVRCAAQEDHAIEWRPERGAENARESLAPQPRLLPGQWLLDRHHHPALGDPPFVLRDASGEIAKYVEPTPEVDLESAVGRPVTIRHDTGKTLLASQLDLGLLAPTSPTPLPFKSNPESPRSVLPTQLLSSNPNEPIVLEELPMGNPAPPPTTGPRQIFEQPPLVSGEPISGDIGHVCGPECGPACGDACSPYSYSSNPGYLSPQVWRLFDPGHWLSLGGPMLSHAPPPSNRWGIELGGWTQLGYHSAQTPLSLTKGDLLAFNDVPDGLRWQQQWFWIGRQADGSDSPDWGFRFDLTYGTDAQKTQAFGNPGGRWDTTFDHGYYGWAMPQLYGELAAEDWSVIFGHFFTPVGYEVIPAPDNFFYSHSLTMFNSEPFTHTGALATYQPYSHPAGLEVYLGYTLGWDTGFDQAFGGSNFLGGFSVQPLSGLTLAYLTTIGNFGARSGGGSGYMHSIVADVAVTPRLTYVLQSDYVDYNDQTGSGVLDDQVGVNQYLLYALNRCWGAGARLEWWRTDGDSYYEMTYGLNYRPHPSFVVRPELRYDWSPGGPLAPNRTTLGIDAVLTY